MRISLKAARVNAGLTQQEAADLSGLSVETIKRIERHPTRTTAGIFNKLLPVYGIKYDDVFFLPENLTKSEQPPPARRPND